MGVGFSWCVPLLLCRPVIVAGLIIPHPCLRPLSTCLVHPSPLSTFKEVNGLEHVSLGDAIVLSGLQELSHLLHLLEDHGGWVLGHLHWLGAIRIQAVDQLAQNLPGEEGS